MKKLEEYTIEEISGLSKHEKVELIKTELNKGKFIAINNGDSIAICRIDEVMEGGYELSNRVWVKFTGKIYTVGERWGKLYIAENEDYQLGSVDLIQKSYKFITEQKFKYYQELCKANISAVRSLFDIVGLIFGNYEKD